jgi:hypothetical protein
MDDLKTLAVNALTLVFRRRWECGKAVSKRFYMP